MPSCPVPVPTFPFFPDVVNYYTDIACFHASYRAPATRNAIISWLNYLPILFVFCCARREPKIREYYKTTILFSAYAQFIFTLPQAILMTWFAIAVSEDMQTTVFWCSMLKLDTAALDWMSYNAILAVGCSRFISLVFNQRLEMGFVLGAFTFCNALLVIIVVYMFSVSAVYPHEMCSPLIFFLEDIPALIYNLYSFLVPVIALILNILTVAFLIYIRSRQNSVSNNKKVDELVVATALLLQSAIPAVTIASKAFFGLVQMWLVAAPEWFTNFSSWAGFLTTGLNVLASIIFIKSFQDQFKAMFWFPVKTRIVRPDPTTNTSVIHVKI